MRVITFECSDKVHVYMDGCGLRPARPYYTHQSIEDAKQALINTQDVENPQLEVNGTLYVCKECGTDNVGTTRFVNPNENEVLDHFHGTDLNWCFGNCKDETTLVDSIDYVEKIH